MSDNMTSEISENALSPRDGADALAALRKAHNPEAEPAANPDPDAEGNLTAVVDVEEPTDQSDSEAEQEEVVSLTLPDGQRINADEAVKGYLRQSDYTKRRSNSVHLRGSAKMNTDKKLHDCDNLPSLCHKRLSQTGSLSLIRLSQGSPKSAVDVETPS